MTPGWVVVSRLIRLTFSSPCNGDQRRGACRESEPWIAHHYTQSPKRRRLSQGQLGIEEMAEVKWGIDGKLCEDPMMLLGTGVVEVGIMMVTD